MPYAYDLYGSRKCEIAFIVGMGPSIQNAEKHLAERHNHAFTIALNRAIERVPADYWLWMDKDAYLTSKDHKNAKAAIRCGVDKWKDDYDPDTYVWERAGNPDKSGPEGHRDFASDVFEKGKLAWNGVSAIAAASLAWHLGAYRIVFVGCENRVDPAYVAQRTKEDPSKNWSSIYTFTFARVAEALVHRKAWMHPRVMMVDASHTGITWGNLPLKKTTIPKELVLLKEFYTHLWATGEVPPKAYSIGKN